MMLSDRLPFYSRHDPCLCNPDHLQQRAVLLTNQAAAGGRLEHHVQRFVVFRLSAIAIPAANAVKRSCLQ